MSRIVEQINIKEQACGWMSGWTDAGHGTERIWEDGVCEWMSVWVGRRMARWMVVGG